MSVVGARNNKYAAIVFQLHCQRHTITLSKDRVIEYGGYMNGSHVGLHHELLEDNTFIVFYASVACLNTCNSSSEESVRVLAAVTVVYNNSE